MPKLEVFFLLCPFAMILLVHGATAAIQPSISDLELQLQNCLATIEELREQEESPTVLGSLDYMENLKGSR